MAYEIMANGKATGLIIDGNTVSHRDGSPVRTIDQIKYRIERFNCPKCDAMIWEEDNRCLDCGHTF
jgi:hypothetical protein